MKIVFVCGFVVALAQYISAAQLCGYDVDYSTVFVPTCAGNDILIDWPYYQDFSKYYSCAGYNNPTLQNCPNGKYFSYFLQKCTDCSKFIPAPDCQYLKTNGQPQCIPSGTTLKPTTVSPTTKSTPAATKPTTASTTSSSTETTPTTKKPITVPTPGTEAPTPGPGVPTPPVMSTSAPGIPTPPVEPPTPPTVEITPPSVD